MSSIRPLATITLLAAMGIFLYMKINETPESTATSPAPAEWEDVPKIEFGDSASPSAGSLSSADSAAPAFSSTPAAPAASAPEPASAAPPAAAPALPDLPPVSAPAATESSPPSQAIAEPPSESTATPAAVVSAPKAAASETTELSPPVTEPAATAAPETVTAQTTAPAAEAPPGGSLGLPPIPELPPLPEAGAATEAPGPVAPAPPEVASAAAPTPETTAAPAATIPPSASPFEAARPAINAALSQGELSRAHLLLSEWYNDPALSPAEKVEVQDLLNQLAGTVIYSNEHRLEPAYTVQAGETLETIAEKHHVPWQLLAKINGIASASAIQPGQTVKVVRGPFMGVVDVSDAELTLTIDGRFAGKYTVGLEGAATGEGEWTVEQKQLEPATAPTASAIDRKLVLRSADNPSATVVIATAAAPPVGAPPQGTIRIAPEQSEDLYDILSVGSRVVIRR